MQINTPEHFLKDLLETDSTRKSFLKNILTLLFGETAKNSYRTINSTNCMKAYVHESIDGK